MKARLLGCVAVYLALAVLYGMVWEPPHDEGGTWEQAFGELPIPIAPDPPASLSSLERALDARSAHGLRDVLKVTIESRANMHPPLYYLVFNLCGRAFGTGQLALSLPNLVLGALAVLGIARLARRLVPEPSSSWAALLLAVSPWFLAFSNFTRPYALVLCLSIWSTEIALRSLDPGSRLRWRMLYVLLSLLGVYSLYHYAFVLVWQGAFLAWLAWRAGPGRRVGEGIALLGIALALAVGFAPWLPSFALHLAHTGSASHYFSGSVPPGEWPARILMLLAFFALGEVSLETGGIAEILVWIFLALGAVSVPFVVLAFLPRALRELEPSARAAWLAAPLLPASIVAADLWHGTHTIFVSKSSFALLPLLVLAVVRTSMRSPWSGLRVPGLALWSLLLGAATVTAIWIGATGSSSYEALAEHVARNDSSAHLVVLSSRTRGYTVPLLRALRNADVRQARVTVAPRARLPGLLRSALRDPTVSTITLVNLAVSYDPERTWEAARLDRLAAIARARGYDVKLFPGTEPTDAAAAGGSALWITSPPLQSKYFSR